MSAVVGRVLIAVLLTAGALAGVPAPPAVAATWVAVNTVSGSGLASSLETWDATVVDYDGDGDQDVWVGYHDQGGRLFRNAGTGVYTRVAAAAWPRVNADGKIPDRHLCAWADVDRNGLVDAYCSAGRGGQNLVKTGKDNELWLQTAPGRFSEVGTAWGVGDVCGRSHYVAFLNANGDSYPDLFVGNASPRAVTGDPCDNPANGLPNEQSKLFLNLAGAGFRSVDDWGITGYGGTRCAEVVDVNRDGWDDLLVCGNTATKLYVNNQGTGFTRRRRRQRARQQPQRCGVRRPGRGRRPGPRHRGVGSSGVPAEQLAAPWGHPCGCTRCPAAGAGTGGVAG